MNVCADDGAGGDATAGAPAAGPSAAAIAGASKAEPFAFEAKALTEARALNRSVMLTAAPVEAVQTPSPRREHLFLTLDRATLLIRAFACADAGGMLRRPLHRFGAGCILVCTNGGGQSVSRPIYTSLAHLL